MYSVVMRGAVGVAIVYSIGVVKGWGRVRTISGTRGGSMVGGMVGSMDGPL